MILAFEMTSEISETIYNGIRSVLQDTYFVNDHNGFLSTKKLKGTGFPRIYISKKEKQWKKSKIVSVNTKAKQEPEYQYWVAILVDVTKFDLPPNESSESIYDCIISKLCEKFPCIKDISSFNAYRIVYGFELGFMAKEYFVLLKRGYAFREDIPIQAYRYATSRNAYVPDVEAKTEENKDGNHIIAKSKSANIEIKLEDEKLRFTFSIEKSKIQALKSVLKFSNRDIKNFLKPEAEEKAVLSYIQSFTGKGIYVTNTFAKSVIDASHNTAEKKEKLKELIDEITKKHGITKVLEQVRKDKLTSLGNIPTVTQHLRDIQSIGINPVTISARARVRQKKFYKEEAEETFKEKILFNLVDVARAILRNSEEELLLCVTVNKERWKTVNKIKELSFQCNPKPKNDVIMPTEQNQGELPSGGNNVIENREEVEVEESDVEMILPLHDSDLFPSDEIEQLLQEMAEARFQSEQEDENFPFSDYDDSNIQFDEESGQMFRILPEEEISDSDYPADI